MTGEKTSRYLELDALRGFAALSVVLFHFTMHREQAHLGFNLGGTGVDLFFIISGFVIFMSVNSISSITEFIINRFTRLYPTYWACVSFTFILYLVINKIYNTPSTIPFKNYLVNLTMFQYYFKIPDIDGPYWTMIIEMVFYIFIAILFSLKQLKHIIPISLCILYIISTKNLIVGTKIWPWYLELQTLFPLLYYFPLFFSGIIFYKIMTEKENHFLYYVFLLFLFTLYINTTDYIGDVINHSEHVAMTVVYFSLFVLFVNKKLGFIVSRPSLFLGKISFALYLIHQYVSTQVLLPLLIDTYHFNFWLAAIISLIVVIVLAALVTYFIEIPFGRRINNVLRAIFKLPKRVSPQPLLPNPLPLLREHKKKIIFAVVIVTAAIFILFNLHKLTHVFFSHDEHFSLKAVNDKYVCADESNNNILVANKESANSWETFLLLRLDSNKCAVYSDANKYFTAELGNRNEITATRDNIADWEIFTMIRLDSNYVAFKAANGKYWSVDEKSSELFASGDSIGKDEKFKFVIK